MEKELTALIIEDNNAIQRILYLRLQKAGIKKIDIADSQEKAVQFINSNEYPIIISDTIDSKFPFGDTEHNPMGPNSVKAAKDLGHKSYIIASSSDEENKYLWENVGYDHFILKSTRYDLAKMINDAGFL